MELNTNFDELLSKNPHIAFISQLNKAIGRMGLTMVYDGVIDQMVIGFIAKAIEEKMLAEKESFKTQKLLFHILIELLQNISKYSDDEKKGKGIVIVGKLPEKYNISSGNVVKNSKIDSLKSFIEHINSLDNDELKKLYETKISDQKFNMHGGAGLGMIDIAKRSKQKLEFNFEPLNNDTSFFLLTVTVLK